MNDRAPRYALAIVRAGSIRRAAEALHVAPAAVSRQVAGLEAALGMPPPERPPRRVVLTETGCAMAGHAARQAGGSVLLEDRLRRLRGVRAGTVRLRRDAGFWPICWTAPSAASPRRLRGSPAASPSAGSTESWPR